MKNRKTISLSGIISNCAFFGGNKAAVRLELMPGAASRAHVRETGQVIMGCL